jgi:hypothetical protein
MVETIGLELETHHPVIEPVSASRRERKFQRNRNCGPKPVRVNWFRLDGGYNRLLQASSARRFR